MFTVKKIYLGEYKYYQDGVRRYVPAGFAIVDENGIPVTWQCDESMDTEVYESKSAAKIVMNDYNENGFTHRRVQVTHSW